MPPHVPLPPVDKRLTRLQKQLGISFLVPDDGEDPAARGLVQVVISEGNRGPFGSLEGGVIGVLVDVSAGSAASYHYGPRVVTRQLIVNYLSAGLVGPAVATATPVRVGKTQAVIEVRVVDAGRDDALMVLATATVAPLADRA